MPERVAVASQRITERTGIAAVVPGAGWRKAVPEPVQLLRVEGVEREAAFHQGLHHRPMRNLDGDPDGGQFGVRRGDEPVRHLRKPGAAVPESPFSQDRPFAVDDAGLVGFRAPVDPHEALKPFHGIPSGLCANGPP